MREELDDWNNLIERAGAKRRSTAKSAMRLRRGPIRWWFLKLNRVATWLERKAREGRDAMLREAGDDEG